MIGQFLQSLKLYLLNDRMGLKNYTTSTAHLVHELRAQANRAYARAYARSMGGSCARVYARTQESTPFTDAERAHAVFLLSRSRE